jgi:hypothetical protein
MDGIITGVQLDGRRECVEKATVRTSSILTDYFRIMRITLRAGREVADADAQAPRVAIVNETLARRLFPDSSALGRSRPPPCVGGQGTALG